MRNSRFTEFRATTARRKRRKDQKSKDHTFYGRRIGLVTLECHLSWQAQCLMSLMASIFHHSRSVEVCEDGTFCVVIAVRFALQGCSAHRRGRCMRCAVTLDRLIIAVVVVVVVVAPDTTGTLGLYPISIFDLRLLFSTKLPFSLQQLYKLANCSMSDQIPIIVF